MQETKDTEILDMFALKTCLFFRKSLFMFTMKSLLFHGTRYLSSILEDDYLRIPEFGDKCVSFTRSFNFAHYYATLSRDDDEGQGHILVFDRELIRNQYPLVLRDGSIDLDRSEAEEAVYCEVYDIEALLLACIPAEEAVPSLFVTMSRNPDLRKLLYGQSFTEAPCLAGRPLF